MATTYSFRLTAEGWDKFAGDMQKLAQTSDVAAQALDRLRQSSPALQSAMERAEQATQRSTEALARHRTANDNAASSFQTLGQRVGSAGQQLQDFLVQAQMGTSLLTALGQQGSQFLGAFGTAGAVAGAGLVLATLGAQFLTAEKSAKALTEAIEKQEAAYKAVTSSANDWHDGLEKEVTELLRLQTYYNSLTESVKLFEQTRLQARRNAINTEAFNTSTRILEPGRGISEVVEGGLPAVDAFGNPTGAVLPGYGTNNTQVFAYTEATRAFRESDLSTESLAALANRMQALSRGSGVVAEAARQTLAQIQQAADDIGKLDQARRQLDGQTEALAGLIVPLPPTIAGPPSASGGGSRRAADQYGPTIGEYRSSLQANIRQQEQAAAASTKAIEEAERRQQQSFDRTVQRYSADLAKGTTDALFDGFSNGANFATTMATTLSRALRTAVASALDVELFRPLISGLLGGSGSAGGGLLSGLSGLLGLNGLGSQISGLFGGSSGGGLLSGVGSSISGLLGTPLFGSSALSSATNSALGAMGGVYGPATPSSLGIGGLTVGSALGSIGLGFGAGSLAGSLTQSLRGTTGPGGTIGSAVGAAAGLAFGPIGALIGGVLGGAGGGLFGPTQQGLASRSGVAGIYTLDGNGRLVIQDVGGKRADVAGFTAGLQAQLDEINNALSSRNLTLQGGGAWSVGAGQAAAGLAGSVDPNSFASMVYSTDSTVARALAALNASGNADFNSTLSTVDFVNQVYNPLSQAGGGTGGTQYRQALRAVYEKYGPVVFRARQLGLPDAGLLAAQDADLAPISAQATAQASQINSLLRSRGLLFNGQGSLSKDDVFDLDPASFASRLTGGNANVRAALSTLTAQGRGDLSTVASSLDWIRQIYEPMTRAGNAADDLQAAIDGITERFAAAIDQARELGLATDGLTAARDREIEATRAASARRLTDSANGLFQDLAFGSGSALAPETQYFAAVSSLRRAAGDLAGGGEEALSRYTSLARTVLPVARDFLGTSQRYGDLVSEVSRTLRGAAPGADMSLASLLEASAGSNERLLEVTATFGAQQVDLLQKMVAEVSGLRAQLVGLIARAA